ncbi:MAG: hypothetical protein ABS46_13505 [Cytophagaceae bacterium SCN 52-12]|nr:MAG: hypothetical protein ABS46_13505 [Cytophagaceae bacterium SCN 52-12]
MESDQTDAVCFESVIGRYEGFRGHYIDVPEEAARHFSTPRHLRLLCSIEGGEEFHCALRPKGNGAFEISVGTPVRKAGKLRLGQKVAVSLRPDHSAYGRPMPEELAELLAIDEEGDRLFHAARPGTQRGILYYINNGRTVQTRIDRAILMIDRLKNKGFS